MKRFDPKDCERCGALFTPTGPSSRYCSDECRKHAIRESSRKSWFRNRDKNREKAKEYYLANLEKLRVKHRQWHTDNKEREAESKREYYQENREAILARCLEYQKNNPQVRRKKARVYGAKKRGVPTDHHTRDDVRDKTDICCYCLQVIDFSVPWHEAHLWPLGYVENGVCLGSDMIINSYPAHPECNASVASSIPLKTNHPLMQDPSFLDLAVTIKDWSYEHITPQF